jgi:hypothetical protein
MSKSNEITTWFALTVERHEKAATEVLRGKGLEGFLPLYCARQVWSDREVRRPYAGWNAGTGPLVRATPGSTSSSRDSVVRPVAQRFHPIDVEREGLRYHPSRLGSGSPILAGWHRKDHPCIR